MLTQRLIGTLASVLIATIATISPAQAEHQRHSDPTVAIIAGAAIVTAGYLLYKNQHHRQARYNDRGHGHDKQYKKHHYKDRHYKKHYYKDRRRYNDYGHKQRYIKPGFYNNDHAVRHDRGLNYDSYRSNKRYTHQKRHYRDSPKYYRKHHNDNRKHYRH